MRTAKKRVPSVDLIWLISEELLDADRRRARPSLAVIPDKKTGLAGHYPQPRPEVWTAVEEQRLAEIQQRLRLIYQLSA